MSQDDKLSALNDHVDFHFWASPPEHRRVLAKPDCDQCNGEGVVKESEEENRCQCTRNRSEEE